MSDCPFCARISAGDCESFGDDPDVVWFEPLNPVTPGHMLFVPVRHVEDALADPYSTAITAEIASRWWSQKWGIRGGERDCNLITSVGAAATQSVRHLHLHLVPRRAADGLRLPWTGQHRAESGGESEAAHEHVWKRCPDCPNGDGPCACAGVPCCDAERAENESAAEAYMEGVKAERERLQPAIDRVQRLATAAQEKAVEHAVRAERERLYAELGTDHFVIFTEDGWTTEHSVECRLSGRMHSCAWNDAVRRIAEEFNPDAVGRWRITGIIEGLPDLERADGGRGR